MITAKDVADLRAKTGAGMMDCKKALDENNGDLEKAVDYLRKKGIAKAEKRADKVAAEGVVGSYIHAGGKVGVLIEVNCETDFVANTDVFQALVKDIAMHIAAINPKCVSREEVPVEDVEKEKEIYRGQMVGENKPAEIVEKIIEGKLGRFFSEICLLEQPFIKDEEKTIEKLIAEKTGEIGEKISVRRFARFALGEGIVKEKKDLNAEVAEQLAS